MPRTRSFLLSTVLIVLSFGLALGPASADIESGLMAHWTFDETEGDTAHDSSGNGYDGAIGGTIQWVEGVVGGALDFDGSSTWVDVNQEILRGTFTYALWLYARNLPYSTGYRAVMHTDAWSAGTPHIHLRATTSAFNVDCNGGLAITSATAFEPDRWYHVVAVIDFAGGQARVYIDGVLDATSTGGGNEPILSSFAIGVWQAEMARWYDGIMDDIRIYNRALSDDDVVELFNWTGAANAGKDFSVYGGDRATLSGSGPADATSFKWEQIAGTPTVTLEPSPNQAVVQFDAPELEIGTILTFRLTVDAPSTEGETTDTVDVIVRAINAPKVAPGRFRVMPLDLGTSGLGFRVEWTPLVDAEQYDIGLDFGGIIIWLETIGAATYEVKGLTEGQSRTIAIRGRNKYGSSDDPTAIAKVSSVAMRNLARPASMGGKSEPSGYVYVISHYAITGMNNIAYDDTNDSWNGLYKEEDYWGYLWASPLFFDHIAYYTGDMFGDGGWFLDLKVQYTLDGTTWLDAPIVKIEPTYDFTDQRAGKQRFTRYDIAIPTLRGTGIRIAGTPGGSATFTSISEMEVFGLQTQG
ncbi:MAG: LamG-like jellyroll fold domain-containing protein, partial [bacterium]|nr:LamG-like jellyroll fold domain-containing protein [bacterium]